MKFTITEYDVSDCQYGRREKNTPPEAAIFERIMREFSSWVGRQAHITHTRVAAEDIYVKEVASGNGLHCVVIWKKTGDSGVTLALKKDDRPGESADVKKKDFGEGYIPGEPLYFLLDPQRMRFFTLRPQGAERTERTALEKTICHFMKTHAKDLEREIREGDGVKTVVVRTIDKNGKSPHPKFEASVKRKDAVLDDLARHGERISKLVHEINLANWEPGKKSSVIRQFVGLISDKLEPREFEKTSKVRYEMDIHVTTETLSAVIDQFDSHSGAERYGFKLKGDNRIRWADECIAVSEHELDIAPSNGVFSARSLLDSAGIAVR